MRFSLLFCTYILSFLFILFLSILYFSFDRFNNFENKIYKKLLIVNLFGVVVNIICEISFMFEIKSLMIWITKILLVYFIFWLALFFRYVLEISIKKNNVIIIINQLVAIISSIIIFFLSYDAFFEPTNGIYYTFGADTKFTYFISILYCLFLIILVIFRHKSITQKKAAPIYVLLILFVIAGLIQHSFPQITIIVPAETFICLIMYFTIENPDMKMLEEAHRAKEITDNANEEKTIFLYNATNIIRGITKDIEHDADSILLEADNKDINTENIKDDARDIKANTAKFTTLTNEILDISSLDSASIKIYNDKYNIKLIISELVQVYKAKVEEKGLEFRTGIASDLPEYLYGDAINVKASLNTILDNSIKYTEKGYVEFRVNPIIKNDIVRLIISIEDSGIGMKAEDLNKIFNKRVEEKEGTNLKKSLYNAKKLVTLMGGTIIPSSTYGKGTNIKVVLDQKIVEEKKELNKYEEILDKKRILLVDDNISSVKMITKLLKDSNINLESVSTGKECLDRIREKEKYDLILLDEHMSPLDGITVMRKLKEVISFNTNVILLTRNNDYEYSNEHISYGFKDYLLKPIDKEKLLEKISKYSK